MSYYDHDDDDIIQRLNVDDYINDIDWVERIIGQVLPEGEQPEIGYQIIDRYDAECWVSGGRFDKAEYDNDPYSLLETIKEVYNDYNWEV